MTVVTRGFDYQFNTHEMKTPKKQCSRNNLLPDAVCKIRRWWLGRPRGKMDEKKKRDEEKRIFFRRETRWQGLFNNDLPTPLIDSNAPSSFLLSFSFSFPSAVVRV